MTYQSSLVHPEASYSARGMSGGLCAFFLTRTTRRPSGGLCAFFLTRTTRRPSGGLCAFFLTRTTRRPSGGLCAFPFTRPTLRKRRPVRFAAHQLAPEPRPSDGPVALYRG